LDFCDANHVELAIVRCAVEDVAAAHALMATTFLLMDTLVYYERDLAASPIEMRSADGIEELQIGDPEQVESIARECFRESLGHYHADLRLDRQACVEVYASWARSSCDRIGPGEFVLVAGDRSNRIGFSTFRRNEHGEGELLLGAVAPAARGRGLYRGL